MIANNSPGLTSRLCAGTAIASCLARVDEVVMAASRTILLPSGLLEGAY